MVSTKTLVLKHYYRRQGFDPKIAIPSGSCRARKPPKAGNTKKLQDPPPWLRPRKHEKKYRKNTKMARKWPFFCIFSVIIFVFSEHNPRWRILYFFHTSGLWGFLCAVRARRNASQKRQKALHHMMSLSCDPARLLERVFFGPPARHGKN